MSHGPKQGALVVLEGAEGVGKSTQLRRLVARMTSAAIPHCSVREPGGTPVGDEIRRLLLDPNGAVVPRAEALLFMASRAQLIDTVVRPAIAQGQFVLADRFFLATYAYQIEGRGLDAAGVQGANAFATAGLTPGVTLLLDLPADEGMTRIAARGEPDRMERSGADFHARVAAAFRTFAGTDWQHAHPECGPIVAVDARGSEDAVADRIWMQLCSRWPETFRPVSESHN